MCQDVIPDWLRWARRLQAVSQTGIHYSNKPFDRSRYEEIGEIAREIIKHKPDIDTDLVKEQMAQQSGYATPKVAVRGAVFQDGQLLLVKEKMDGLWAMPGGWANVNETPSSMVEREVWEESSYRVRARRLIGVYESNHDRHPLIFWHNYKILFLCDLVGGSPRMSEETDAVAFFDSANLPELSPFRTQQREIEAALAHYREVQKPTYFD